MNNESYYNKTIRHKTLSLSIASSLLIISLMSQVYIKSLKSKKIQHRKENSLKLYDMEKENCQRIAALGAEYFINEARNMMSALKVK